MNSMILEKGRICLKIAGREAGSYCVVVEPVDESFVMITGPKTITRVRRKKCNTAHLEATDKKFSLNTGEDSEIETLWRNSGLIEEFGIELPKFKQKK